MKNGELLNLYETLNKLSNEGQKFNIKVSYAFARDKEKLREEAQIIYNLRREILLQYGTINDQGDIVIPKDKIDEVNKKINELMEIEIDPPLVKILPEWLEDYKLDIDTITQLLPIIEDIAFTKGIID